MRNDRSERLAQWARRYLLTVVALAVPLAALAAQSWSGAGLTRRGTFTTGTEAVPTLADGGQDPTAGIDLSQATGVGGLNVFVASAADGGTSPLTACSLLAYAWNSSTGQWVRANDSDLSVSAQTSQAFLSLLVTSPRTRFLLIPSGCGYGSTVDLQATVRR